MKNLFILTLIFIFIFNITAFAHVAEVKNNGENKYKSIRITPEIYNLSNSDLSDILIKSEKDEIVPYFINTSYMTIYKGDYTYPMELINSYVKDDNFYYDYKLTETYSHDILATSIKFLTDKINFAKSIEVYGSYDNIHWEKIKNDNLYSVDDNIKLSIDFESPQKYTHYRFKISNNLEKISFTNVALEYKVSKAETSYFIETIKPEFTIEEKDTQTYININGLKHLKPATITVVSDNIFKRNLVTPFGEKEIYNLVFEKENYSDTTIPIGWHIIKDDIFKLYIENNDDKPIDIKEIIVTYYAEELVFDGSGSNSFKIEFSGDKSKTAPKYDIESYKYEVLKQSIDKLEINNIIFEEEVKAEPKDYTMIFNVIVVIVAVLLGGIILLKMKK